MKPPDPTADKGLEMRLTATAAAVPAARRAVGTFAESHGVDRPQVELAVAEAVANAVVHAFPDGTPGEVVIQAWAPAPRLRVDISDNGVGMRRNPDSPGLGVGLALIERLTSEFTVAGTGAGGTLISMRFETA